MIPMADDGTARLREESRSSDARMLQLDLRETSMPANTAPLISVSCVYPRGTDLVGKLERDAKERDSGPPGTIDC